MIAGASVGLIGVRRIRPLRRQRLAGRASRLRRALHLGRTRKIHRSARRFRGCGNQRHRPGDSSPRGRRILLRVRGGRRGSRFPMPRRHRIGRRQRIGRRGFRAGGKRNDRRNQQQQGRAGQQSERKSLSDQSTCRSRQPPARLFIRRAVGPSVEIRDSGQHLPRSSLRIHVFIP